MKKSKNNNKKIFFLFILMKSLFIELYSMDSTKELEPRVNKALGSAAWAGNHFAGDVDVHYHGGIVTETDERDSFSEFSEMELPLRKKHEEEITDIYHKALAGDVNDLKAEARKGDPFAQIYWSHLILSSPSSDKSKPFSYIDRCKRLFDRSRKIKGKSEVFSFLCGFVNDSLKRIGDVLPYDYIEAADKFENMLAQLELAKLLYKKKEYASSLEYYDVLVDNRNEKALQHLCQIADTDEDMAVDIFRLNLALRYEKGNAVVVSYDEAIRLYRMCIRGASYEYSAKSLYRLAKIHEIEGRYKEAAESYYAIFSYVKSNIVFDLDSGEERNVIDDLKCLCERKNGYALFYRGKIYEELGSSSKLEMALVLYKRARLATDKPKDSELIYYIAGVYRKLSQFDEASWYYFSIADDQRALSDLDELCEENNGFAQFYRARIYEQKAQVFERLEDLESANQCLYEALHLFGKVTINAPSMAAESKDQQGQIITHRDLILERMVAQSGRRNALGNRYEKSTIGGVSNTTAISAFDHYA